MSFTSAVFFPFLALYLALSAFVSQRTWLWIVASFSAIFYGFWDWRFLFLLYYVSIVSWYCGRRIALGSTKRERKAFVAVSIVSCLLVLATFKYFNFFSVSLVRMAAAFGFHFSPPLIQILLPIGISFYTFHALSYTIDIYRGKLRRSSDLISVIVYLSFFPQLVAGPIVRAHRFLPQIERGVIFSLRKVKLGILLIVWGYFLKIGVADSIGVAIKPFFASPAGCSTGDLLFAIFAYSFQIYGDFAGYSFVAIGLAKLQGFDFPANFLAPYFAKSFSEFWRRWHISLSSFLRDYLYIPLGGNRHGKLNEYRNLFVTMFLGGLWHGASYNFVIWGALHGGYLIVQRILNDTAKWLGIQLELPQTNVLYRTADAAIKIAVVYALVLFAWIFFRNRTFAGAEEFIAVILTWQGVTLFHQKFLFLKCVALIVTTIGVDAVFINRRRVVELLRSPVAISLVIASLFCALELFGSFGGGAFIYFQF
jgi:alginate O-acetyltransferase complex protein AlgI